MASISDSPWAQLAKAEPTFYMATHQKAAWWEEDAFLRLRPRAAEDIIAACAPYLHTNRRAVAIGVGVGRCVMAMSRRFLRVTIVGDSPFVVEQLRDRCMRYGCANIACALTHDAWDAEPVDFACSLLHFAHVADDAAVAGAIARLGRCLAGVAYLQFDTTPQAPFTRWEERIIRQIARWGKWERRRRSAHRYPRSAAWVRTTLAAHGLTVVDEQEPNGPYHGFIVTADLNADPRRAS